LEEQVAELKSRVGSLQQELDNSEAVQKDFVRLSQSLQVQLERIREADTQVRWQHDEDVEECQGCRTGFSFTRSKVCTRLLQLKTYSEQTNCPVLVGTHSGLFSDFLRNYFKKTLHKVFNVI
jgi:hypothetical protein